MSKTITHDDENSYTHLLLLLLLLLVYTNTSRARFTLLVFENAAIVV
jgi:hypothetical protein